MKEWQERTYFGGLDWASDHHDLVIVDRAGQLVESFTFAHSGPGWEELRRKLAPYPGLAIAVETNQGAAVQQLIEAGLEVYPVNPKSAQRYRERKAPSGVKDDQLDAWSLADALRLDGHGWRVLVPEDPLIEQLRLLCRDEIALIEQRTALVNQLMQALREYYPAALEAFDNWTKDYTWRFLERFPTPDKLQSAGKRQWEKFLHTHKLWRPDTAPKRLEIFARANAFGGSPAQTAAKSLLALSCARVLLTLECQLLTYRAAIEALFAEHPDSGLFGSLPGAGPKLAPRLLAEIGDQRERFSGPQSLQCHAGTAPITIQSGQIRRHRLRHACDLTLRSTVHQWADHSRKTCPWAQTYYRAHRAKGQSHACALRCLGQRWLKILWKMWQTHSPYNEALHTRNQTRHGSWVLQFKPA
jgi:transposase